MPHRQREEQAIQRAVFAHLRQRAAPDVFAFHPANGGWRSPVEGAIFKGMGVVPGVPDVIAIKDGRVYGLELKAKGGRTSEHQVAALAAMAKAGAMVAVAIGVDNAILQLEEWGLLRGRAAALVRTR